MTSHFQVPTRFFRTSTEVKSSRFIGSLYPLEEASQVKDRVAATAAEFPQANHHCWAYQIGDPKHLIQGCSDDGEPQGTAGRPMLSRLHHAQLTNVLVVVSRVFGGIKLGTGGLVRAYSEVVANAIEQVDKRDYVNWQGLQLEYGYHQEALIKHVLEQFSTEVLEQEYVEVIRLKCRVNQKQTEALKASLVSVCAGDLRFHFTD